MKQGWEIKKLGEIARIINGYAFDSKLFSTDENDMPLIRIRDIKKGYTETFYKGKYSDNYIVKNGDYIIGMDGEFNITEWGGGDALLNQRVCKIEIVDDSVIGRYVLRFLSIELKRIEDATSFVTVKHLSSKSLLSIPIPVPERAEQERIVGELDCLSGIIAAKRAQLRELDTLAQSIFYTMFGDPITNDKGWSVKQLKDVSTLINGRAYKQEELLSEGKYKVIRVGNFFTNGDYYYSDLELDDDKYCDIGDLLFAWSASFGAFIWNGGKVIYHYHIWKVLFDERKLNIQYYRYILNVMTNDFMKDVHGIGMFHLTKAGMEQYKLPIPPLSLQNEFAEKIENIERQKELITKSIKETEDLFNSRMDYYFN